MFERRLYYHIDWLLIAAVFALCAIGLAMIYSTTGGLTRVYWTQVYAVGLGTLAMAVCLAIDYRSISPITMSSEPTMAGTSASNTPRQRGSVTERLQKQLLLARARIGSACPSPTR